MVSGTRETRTSTVPGAAHQAALLREPVIGLRILGPAVEHRIPTTEREFTLGSAEARSIRLAHPSVSHLHARIERRDHHLILIDCDSKNGCYAEGERRAVIHVPALASRRHELSRVVTDAVSEHAGPQGASAAVMTAHDYECLLAHDWPRNHDEVEEVVERLTALRMHGKVRKAAKALGMSPGSLSEWASKYGFRVDRWPGGRSRAGGD